METNLNLMRCGACGNDTVKIYCKDENHIKTLFAECTQCKSVSRIRITEPKIHIDWDEEENSEGILCVF